MAIPFYGAARPDLLAIERRAMDRPGKVTDALARHLPSDGTVIDVGAGDGYLVGQLTTPTRTVVAVEPAAGMRDQRTEALPFVAALAQALPFATASAEAAVATWAYFFTGHGWDPEPGIRELHRVVRPGGLLLIVHNLGGDEFTALAEHDIAADPDAWRALGFACEEIDTEFAFAGADEARLLLDFYFGPVDRPDPPLRYSYRVGVFHVASTGP